VPSPTATRGSSGVLGDNAARSVPLLARALTSIPPALSSIAQLAGGGGGVNGGGGSVTNCSGGGSRDFTCTQPIPAVSPRDYSLSFANCVLASASGSVGIDGAMSASSTQTGALAICSLPPLQLSTLTVNGVEVSVSNDGGMEIEHATFNVNGSLTATPNLLSACRVSALDLVLSGTIEVNTGALNTTLQLDSNHLLLDIDSFSSDCVPTVYRLTLNDPITLSLAGVGDNLAATFTDFVLRVDSTGGDDQMRLIGDVSADCYGGVATFTTVSDLVYPRLSVCPSAGELPARRTGWLRFRSGEHRRGQRRHL
jgi:hypothetical protein